MPLAPLTGCFLQMTWGHRDRLEKAHQRLLRLQKTHHPMRIKTMLIHGAVYPAAFFGAEILP